MRSLEFRDPAEVARIQEERRIKNRYGCIACEHRKTWNEIQNSAAGVCGIDDRLTVSFCKRFDLDPNWRKP